MEDLKYINQIEKLSIRTLIKTLYNFKNKEGVIIVQKTLKKAGLNLKVDGLMGPITLALLNKIDRKLFFEKIEEIMDNNSDEPLIKNPYWLDLAKKELGVKEIRGSKHNPRVLEYHSVSGGFSTDEVPWCASFINFIMLKAGYKGPKHPAAAKSWLNFGKTAHKPVYGAIAVKSRKGGGHVCFVVGKSNDNKYLYCLGGNQNDEVNIRKYKTNVFLDFRIPLNFEPSEELSIYDGSFTTLNKES
jgi:uncharacterized protein (TIGR02594 family)